MEGRKEEEKKEGGNGGPWCLHRGIIDLKCSPPGNFGTRERRQFHNHRRANY
jgi:hypothetical protein